MKCQICEKTLETGEAVLCNTCYDFMEYKYGTFEDYLKIKEVLPDE